MARNKTSQQKEWSVQKVDVYDSLSKVVVVVTGFGGNAFKRLAGSCKNWTRFDNRDYTRCLSLTRSNRKFQKNFIPI